VINNIIQCDNSDDNSYAWAIRWYDWSIWFYCSLHLGKNSCKQVSWYDCYIAIVGNLTVFLLIAVIPSWRPDIEENCCKGCRIHGNNLGRKFETKAANILTVWNHLMNKTCNFFNNIVGTICSVYYKLDRPRTALKQRQLQLVVRTSNWYFYFPFSSFFPVYIFFLYLYRLQVRVTLHYRLAW
jgi:hypothetical protein